MSEFDGRVAKSGGSWNTPAAASRSPRQPAAARRSQRKRRKAPQLRPTHPHAPGARMTVVNKLPQIKKYGKIRVLGLFGLVHAFLIFYNILEVPGVFKNLPGTRGFVVLRYGPVASHGDHVHARNDSFLRSWQP